jgi:hypothetical protein
MFRRVPSIVGPLFAAVPLIVVPQPVRAQQPVPPAASSVPGPSPGELPLSDPSYAALRTLARKGLVEGLPPDTDPFGGRIGLTRYEMASFVARMIRRLEPLLRPTAAGTPRAAVSTEDLALARTLVGRFRVELAVIGVDLERLAREIPEIAPLSSEPSDPPSVSTGEAVRSSLGQVIIIPEHTGDETSLLYRLQNRLTGYFQFRYDALLGERDLFRSTGGGGSGPRPGTGGPAVGAANSGFLVRRGRIRVSEQLTPRDEFVFQIDLPTNAAPNIRDAFVRVLDFPVRNLALRAGQYAFSYGWEYLYSSRSRETPERALGFSDSTQASLIYKSSVSPVAGEVTPGSVLPFFNDQDRDIGVEIAYGAPWKRGPVPRAAFSIIQGEGRGGGGQRSLNSVYDIVASVEATESRANARFGAGLSYYRGAIPVRSGPSSAAGQGASPSAVPPPFVNARREFGGAYLRYQTRGAEYRAEYSGGAYEVTPDRARHLPGNRFDAWYIVTRQPLARWLEGYVKYDEFNPVRSDELVGGVKGGSLSRRAFHLGVLYQYTPATRFRVNFIQGLTPYDPSAPAGSRLRSHLGLLQAEIQMVY